MSWCSALEHHKVWHQDAEGFPSSDTPNLSGLHLKRQSWCHKLVVRRDGVSRVVPVCPTTVRIVSQRNTPHLATERQHLLSSGVGKLIAHSQVSSCAGRVDGLQAGGDLVRVSVVVEDLTVVEGGALAGSRAVGIERRDRLREGRSTDVEV